MVIGFLILLLLAGIGGAGYYWITRGVTVDGITVGKFKGDLILKALPDGRNMEVVQPYEYVDGKGLGWGVPSGAIVDGASIPQALWSTIGGPFEGKYRNASVIHDHFCGTQERSWEATHLVFYEAMLASDVDAEQALWMFYAVYRFGPQWDVAVADTSPPAASADDGAGAASSTMESTRAAKRSASRKMRTKPFDAAEMAQVRQDIRSGKLKLPELLQEAKTRRQHDDRAWQ